MGPYQVLPLRARVDEGAMAIKEYSAFPKAPLLLEPHHQIVKCHIHDTRCGWGSYPSLKKQSVYFTASPDCASSCELIVLAYLYYYHIYIHIYIKTHICIYTHIYTHMYIHIYIHINIYSHTNIHVRVCVDVRVCVCEPMQYYKIYKIPFVKYRIFSLKNI